MSKLTCHITIVSEQKHTSCITVETANRIDALRACSLNKIHNCFALLWVITCCNIILWLIQKHIHFLSDCYRLLMELNLICAKNLCSKFGYYLSINRNNSCLDKLICLTTAANASICKELIQTYWFVWIIILLLILNTFLQTVFCIWIISWCWFTESAALLVTALLTIAATLLVTTLLLTIATALLVTALLLTIAAALLVTTLLLTVAAALLITTLLLTVAAALLVTALLLTIAAALLVTTLLLTVTATLLVSTIIITRAIRLSLLISTLV